LSNPDLRQRSHAGLNKGEASNSLRRAVFFHRQGEIRDRTFENQSFQASGLSLITAAIVHWNTVYLDRAVQHLCTLGIVIRDTLLAHVDINMTEEMIDVLAHATVRQMTPLERSVGYSIPLRLPSS
jgi:Tn3 transposase DDE domain